MASVGSGKGQGWGGTPALFLACPPILFPGRPFPRLVCLRNTRSSGGAAELVLGARLCRQIIALLLAGQVTWGKSPAYSEPQFPP